MSAAGPTTPTVAIVILNWNGRAHLARYLPSVIEHSVGARVVVADNGSTDDSELVARAFRDVEWLPLGENFGYAEGYNRALAAVEAGVFVLLNSDVRVTDGWLPPLLARFAADPTLGAAQPKILADERPTEFEYAGAAGGYLDALGYPYCRGRIFDTVEEDTGQYDGARACDWASGACLFVRASALRAVGGLDASYFAHMEEIDLCWRLRRAGYGVWVDPASVVYHLGGGTLKYASPRKTYLNFRNSLTTLFKNHRVRRALPRLLVRTVLDAVAGLRFLFAGQPAAARAVLRAHGGFYRGLCAGRRARGRFAARFPEADDAALHSVGPPVRSIVWAYYARGRRRFSELP